MYQRKKLDQDVFHAELARVIDAYQPNMDFGLSLAYQGFDSLKFTEFAGLLQPFFPSLAPQDFYRYKTINQLIDRFGIQASVELPGSRNDQRNGVPIRSSVLQHLCGGNPYDGSSADPGPGIDRNALEGCRYRSGDIGQKKNRRLPRCLSQEYGGDKTSVYYPSGTNPSIIAARISYHYDLRGPSWVSNTACSSSLVAVHYAAKDIEAGRVDYAIAENRTDTVYIGSVKSNMGHLESAAGIAGLINSVAALNYGIIPPNLHFNQSNPHIDFESLPLKVVTEATTIDNQANIGISSFGFGGSNAHIVVKGAQASVRKAIRSVEIPFDRGRAASLSAYLRLLEPGTSELALKPDSDASGSDASGPLTIGYSVRRLIQELMASLSGIETIDPDLELLEQGLDSLSGTELISQLETSLNIELGPEILFEFPLRDQFIDEVYALTGEGLN